MFQIGFCLSAFKSGLLLLASALGNLGMKAVIPRILRRHGFRKVSVVATLVAGVATVACGILQPDSPLVVVLIVIITYGLARSMQLSILLTLGYADINPCQMNAASTLGSAVLQMTIGLGIAYGAIALRAASLINGDASDTTGAHLMLGDFRLAFIFAGSLTLLSAVGYLRFAPNAGQSMGVRSMGQEPLA